MSQVLLYRLKMNREAILKDLEPDLVLDYLYQEDVLDSDKYDQVLEKGSRKRQAELLLSIVESDSAAIEKIIHVLERSSQRHLASILKKELPDEIVQSQGILKSLKHDPDVPYPMTHVPCGYAVIINNIEFDQGTGLETRLGSEVDVTRMTELFEWLQFKVEVHRNKKAAEIRSTVRHYCCEKEHNKFDCFVLFLMSHGSKDSIFGTDGELVNLRRDIRQFLIGDKCDSLSGKPKLIFVQACRGSEANEGLVVTESGYSVVGNLPNQEASPYPVCTPSNLDMTPSFTPATDFKYSIPQDSDILIFYASSWSYAAHRHTREGGWFVMKLYDVMRKYARTEDLQGMITRVIGQTATKKVEKHGKLYMQCPEQIGNLRKKVFFNPSQRNLGYD